MVAVGTLDDVVDGGGEDLAERGGVHHGKNAGEVLENLFLFEHAHGAEVWPNHHLTVGQDGDLCLAFTRKPELSCYMV